MIATLRGEVSQVEDNAIIVNVAGVGLRVFIPLQSRARLKIGESVFLFTHLAVREDALTLYGFDTQAERDLFLMLLSVDGIGPRLGLSVLSTLTIDAIQSAVHTEASEILSRVPGVGKKTAQKIVLYLHDRLKPSDTLAGVAAMSDGDGEVLAALTALGYSVIEAQAAIQSLPTGAAESVEERLRLALQYFQ